MAYNNRKITLAIAGAAAAGVGFATAYYLYRKTQASQITSVPIRIETYHQSYLQASAATYTQGDQQEALRRIIAYCINISSSSSESEQTIFTNVRCNSCGKKEKIAYEALITNAQLDFVNRVMATYNIDAGQEKAVRIMLEYCINEVEDAVIFA